MENLGGLLKASYKTKNLPEGYKKDTSLSGKRVQVYTDEAGKGVVVHRGTQGLKDVLTDAYISVGGDIKKTDRYKQSKKISDLARQKYGDITQVGHSLGGKLAEDVGSRKDKIITYNKAAVITDIGRTRKPMQTDIRHKKDLISLISTTQKGGKTKTLKDKTKNVITAHSLDFL